MSDADGNGPLWDGMTGGEIKLELVRLREERNRWRPPGARAWVAKIGWPVAAAAAMWAGLQLWNAVKEYTVDGITAGSAKAADLQAHERRNNEVLGTLTDRVDVLDDRTLGLWAVLVERQTPDTAKELVRRAKEKRARRPAP